MFPWTKFIVRRFQAKHSAFVLNTFIIQRLLVDYSTFVHEGFWSTFEGRLILHFCWKGLLIHAIQRVLYPCHSEGLLIHVAQWVFYTNYSKSLLIDARLQIILSLPHRWVNIACWKVHYSTVVTQRVCYSTVQDRSLYDYDSRI